MRKERKMERQGNNREKKRWEEKGSKVTINERHCVSGELFCLVAIVI